MSNTSIYLDYAAATPLDERVFAAMEPFLRREFGNPSSLHTLGVHARQAVENARKTVARALSAEPDEIVFTSGTTESINVALLGVLRAHGMYGKHVITAATEHDAGLKALAALGCEVTYVSVDVDGQVRPEDVVAAIRPDTILVSLMHANNEIGTVLPIAAIGREILKNREARGSIYPLFHTDAAQTVGVLPCDVRQLHVDLLSFGGAKLYGPKGIGALYIRRGVEVAPLFFGGNQERGHRAGTENVPGIVGLAKAVELAEELREAEAVRLTGLRDGLIDKIQTRIQNVRLNGHRTDRLPGNIDFSFPGVDGEELVLRLDAAGIAASTAAACKAGGTGTSSILEALGRTPEEVKGSLRFTLGRGTTSEELEAVLGKLVEIVVS